MIKMLEGAIQTVLLLSNSLSSDIDPTLVKL